MGKIKWTEKAGSNIEAIFDFIAKDSKLYAFRFVRSLVKATKKLETMPECGRMVPELPEHNLREVVFRNYRIVYRIIKESDDVEILVVMHGACKIEKTILNEWEL